MTTKLTRILAGAAALMLHAGLAVPAAAQVPEACLQPKLSKEIQRFCDQLMFADVPHYLVVRLADNGAVRSIRQIETVTGREIVNSYPHGLKFSIPDEVNDSELRIRTEELEGILTGRPTPAGTPPTLGEGRRRPARDRRPRGTTLGTDMPVFGRGLAIGWNSSTGPTSGQCLNYTIAQPGGNVEQASFSSQNAASSTSEQLKVSATVNVAFDFLEASDTFSFSDTWQSSTNSSNQYFNLYSLYTLNSTVPSTNPLNDQGKELQDDETFDTLCGTAYLASMPVGILVTISIDYGSSSESTTTEISNQFSLSFGLDSLTAAVDTAKKSEDSTSYFTVTMTKYGGGADASNALLKAFNASDQGQPSFYVLCQQGDAQGCSKFVSSMGQGAAAALAAFHKQVDALSGATTVDLSFLQPFPSGVAGATIPGAVTAHVPVDQISDVLRPYKARLEDYVSLANQLATLVNRVKLLSGLLTKVPSFNPGTVLDLKASYLDRLQQIYSSDRKTVLKNLKTCLEASSDTVESDCQPIIANQAKNVYDYYDKSAPTADFFAQQNTLALQYTATEVFGGPGVNIPPGALDVIYIDKLPSFSAAPGLAAIAGEAALVSFYDRPIPFGSAGLTSTNASVRILALEPGQPLSTSSVSKKARNNADQSQPFTWWTLDIIPHEGGDLIGVFARTNSTFVTTDCTPTFTRPCAIDYFGPATQSVDSTQTVENGPIVGLFD
jgi:hypothetical protein